jgi:hypothetical protein
MQSYRCDKPNSTSMIAFNRNYEDKNRKEMIKKIVGNDKENS